MKERKILGWCVLVPRLFVMVAASISMYHAFSVNSIIGIIAGIALVALYLIDVLYLTVVLIHDLIKKDDSWSAKTDREIDEMIEDEKELFKTYDDKQ